MKKFLRTFDTEEEYLAYTASTEYYLNSVARCRQGSLVFYNPEDCGGHTPPVPPTPSDWDIIAKFNVTDTSSPTPIASAITNFSKIEIDGVEQPSVVSAYTFSTTGEHTVKYKLIDKTSIGNGAFAFCYNLTNVDIPDSVTSIGDDAFTDCYSLTSVEIPSGITSIGETTFANCSGLTSVEIPSGVTSIESHTFSGCTSLTSIDIPSGVTTIGNGAFYGCSGLTSIDIPSGVTIIHNSTFELCTRLTSIDIPSGVTYIGDSAFYGCSGLTSIDIPSGVTTIYNHAFNRCSGLTSVTINAVTPPTLGFSAFTNTNNCPIYVPCDSVDAYKAATNWSSHASRIQAIAGSCWDITAKYNVTSTSSPTRIGYNQYTSGFSAIEIDGVVQPNVVSAYTFSTTGEHTVRYTLTDPTSIGACAFFYCSGLTSVTIPDSVTSLGYSAFERCSGMTSIDIPDSVTSISNRVFWECTGLTSCTIGSGVTSIGQYVFFGCSGLTRLNSNVDGVFNIPDSVTSIGSGVFHSCSGLRSCTIGSGVTSIVDRVFYNCYSLTSIISNATTAPSIYYDTFENIKTGGTLTVPIGSTGYDVWMRTGDYYLGKYNWTKVEQ